MKTWLVIVLLLGFSGKTEAQLSIPFDFTSEEENRLIKENDSLKYYVATTDTSNVVVINEEANWYKLLSKNHKLIAEGAYVADGDKLLQEGKWVALFEGGKTRMAGYYHRNMPIGTWTEYYNSGKVKTTANYGVFIFKGQPASCLSGTWQEFHPNGLIKVNGFYSGTIYSYKDTVQVDDPVSDQKVPKVITHNEMRAEKMGHWEYYDEAGELERSEDF